MVHKTIYDPSPASFTLPKSAAFTSFTTTGNVTSNISLFNVNGAFNLGWNFYCRPNFNGLTIFFPGLSKRTVWSSTVNASTAGSIHGEGLFGNYCHSAVPLSSSQSWGLGFFSGYVSPEAPCYKAQGSNVRSVLE